MSIIDIIARCNDIKITDEVELIVWLESAELSKYFEFSRMYRKVNITVLDLLSLSLGNEYGITFSVKNGIKIECVSRELYFEIEKIYAIKSN